MLTNYWQLVFDPKNTDKALRDEWLRRINGKLKLAIDELRPTYDDVKYVLAHLPTSSPGPDGIPCNVFQKFQELIVPIFYDMCQAMLDGNAILAEEFNYAFLICLPKGFLTRLLDNTEVYEPSGTRPLSVVDAANRIIAFIFVRGPSNGVLRLGFRTRKEDS